MSTSRRSWLKQVGFGIAGVSLANLPIFAAVAEAQQYNSTPGTGSPIFLNSNENPYGPSPLARKALAENPGASNRYNWELYASLMSAIAQKNHVAPENIILGAGSTEILELVARYAALKDGNFITADPSYEYWSEPLYKLGLQKIKVPLDAEKRIDLMAMAKTINEDTRLVYICNPNNPTGTICVRSQLEEFIRAVPEQVIILVDEAYLDFTVERSLSDLTTGRQNLIVVKTFSKMYGLAGARIGYGIGHKATIEQLGSMLSSPGVSVSVLSRLAAIASLKDEKFVTDTFQLTDQVKKYTVEQLSKLNLTYIPSYTNFIYFSLANYHKDYFAQLEKNNIKGTKIYEAIGQWTRITVGTMAEMQSFIDGIR